MANPDWWAAPGPTPITGPHPQPRSQLLLLGFPESALLRLGPDGLLGLGSRTGVSDSGGAARPRIWDPGFVLAVGRALWGGRCGTCPTAPGAWLAARVPRPIQWTRPDCGPSWPVGPGTLSQRPCTPSFLHPNTAPCPPLLVRGAQHLTGKASPWPTSCGQVGCGCPPPPLPPQP